MFFCRQRGVGMTGEAVFVLELLRGAPGQGATKQQQNERTNQLSAGNIHGIEQTLLRKILP